MKKTQGKRIACFALVMLMLVPFALSACKRGENPSAVPTVSGAVSKEFDKAHPDNVAFDIDDKGKAFTDVKQGVAVVDGANYTYLGGALTFKSTYLSTFAVGSFAFVFTTEGGGVTLTVVVVDNGVAAGGGLSYPGAYYIQSTMNAQRKLFVLGGYGQANAGRHKFITASAIQGLLNRETVRFYVDYPIEKDGVSSSAYWLSQIKNDYPALSTEDKTLEQAVEMYKAETADPGYILYSDTINATFGIDNSRSITAATNLASVTGWLPVDEDLVETAEDVWGLTMKIDATDMTEKDVFDAHKDEFDNRIIVQQRPMENETLPMVPLRDYAIMAKYFVLYESGVTAVPIRFRTEVHEWARPGMPIFGWGPGDEGAHISFASLYGQFPIPSDFSMNMSVLAADFFATQSIAQVNDFTPVTPQAGKHYVAAARSDGDNISVWANEFPLSSTDYLGARDASFAMGWTIQPSLIDIAPAMLANIYGSANAYDHFIAPVSGHGYMYPSTYPEQYRAEWFDKMNGYLGRTDISVVEILDHGQGVILNKDIANLYGQASNLKGGIVLNGDRYAGGRGAVIWSANGKPFVAPRETLWTETKEMVSARINSYHKDYTRIEGYSFINLHPWSHTYQDLEWVVDNFDENVVVVSPEQLIDLITRYVPKTDKTSLEDSGNTIVVPSDPLDNKFLPGAGTEDWAKTSGTEGTVAAVNQWLQIKGSATKTYTIPNKASQWISFDYKSGGRDVSFRVEIEIGGVRKTAADEIKVRNASEGTSNLHLSFDNYFTLGDYGGKQARIIVTAFGENAVSNGVSITNVKTEVKLADDPTSAGDPLNDVFASDREDWIITAFQKNASGRLDNNMIMLDGSDGWTGLFDKNVNLLAAKTFTVPSGAYAKINVLLKSSDMGTDVNAKLIVNGVVHELTQNGWQYISNLEQLKLEKILEDCGGQRAEIIIMQRDSNKNNGIGEVAYIVSFTAATYAWNPLDNNFETGADNWTGTGFTVSGGNAVLAGAAASMTKAMTMPALTPNWRQRFDVKFKVAGAAGTLKYSFKISVGGIEYDVIKDEAVVNAEYVTVSFKEFEIAGLNEPLSEKSVTFTISTLLTGAGADRSLLIDEIVISQCWETDPYFNQFEESIEDWSTESIDGWDNNGFKKDGGQPRAQITFHNLDQAAQIGRVVAVKTYTLLNTDNQKIEFYIGGQNGKYKLELQFTEGADTAKYLLIPFTNIPVTGGPTVLAEAALNKVAALNGKVYAGKEVKLIMTFESQNLEGGNTGGHNAWIDNFRTYAYSGYDAYNNTFDQGIEDWTLESIQGWGDNAFKLDTPNSRAQITYHPAGGPLGQAVASKTYTLLDTAKQKIEFLLGGQDGKFKLELQFTGADTTRYALIPFTDIPKTLGATDLFTVALDTLPTLNGITYRNKDVKLIMTFENGSVDGMDAGAGHNSWMDDFRTFEYTGYDPLNNTFEQGLEDWEFESSLGWTGGNLLGYDGTWKRAKVTYHYAGSTETPAHGQIIIKKTYTLPGSDRIRLTMNLEAAAGATPGTYSVKILVGGTVYTIRQDVTTYNVAGVRNDYVFNLYEESALNGVTLAGQEVTVYLQLDNYDTGTGFDAYLWSFKTEVAE
ncbi:MAG: hypothetical protein LBS99_04895 [Clostridiales bacterium]|jgi:hypothetical protein|nr:hypothetical protein [Clostridiales bacterium]